MSTDSKKYHTYGELPKFKGDIQSYPVWRQDMITYLHGHKVGYTISMADKDFENKVQLIGVWLHDDLALDSPIKKEEEKVKDDGFSKEKKSSIKKYIEDSRSAYAIIYAALNDEHKLLIKNLTEGYAYGIWKFLEEKYQNSGDTD